MKGLEHFVVLDLEGTHDVLASDDEVHDTGYQSPLSVLLGLVAHGYDIHEVHERQKLLMTWLTSFQKLELKLLLEIGQGVVHVFIPSLHEPSGPLIVGLELIEVPVQHSTYFEFLLDDLFGRDASVRCFYAALNMWRIYLFNLGRHMQAGDSNLLELKGLDGLAASVQVRVYVLHRQMKCLPLEPII